MALKMGVLTGVILFITLALVVSEDITVQTSLGNITGEVEEITFDASTFDVTKFLGIPYAEPPTGTRRFNRPIEKAEFRETFIAKTMPPQCVQNWVYLKGLGLEPAAMQQKEDCLYLNIFVPGRNPAQKEPKLAVLIWIYGGDFQMGFQDAFEAKEFVGLNDVILVTFNYRVSLLGFMSTGEDNGSGNYGLWDQHKAIKWVHNHIESFGGDPMRVTLFGSSSGGCCVIYQALFDGNSGLFQRAIAQSGTANIPLAYETNPTTGYKNFANKSGCINLSEVSMNVIECLRNLTVERITELVEFSDSFRPVKDGMFVKILPFDIFDNTSTDSWHMLRKFGKLDFLAGVTSSDGGLFIPVIDMLTRSDQTSQLPGYSRQAFDTIIVDHGLYRAKMKNSRTLQKAIIHQYVDWSDPENTQKVFQNTVDLLSDVVFNNGVTKTAMTHSKTDEQGSLFFYVFDHKGFLSESRLSGATHAEDVGFVLGFPAVLAEMYKEFKNKTIPQEDIDLSRKMMAYWTNFAKTGDPNADGLTPWPQYDTQTQKYIRFQANKATLPVEDHFAARRMHFWHNLVPTLEHECDKSCPDCRDDTVSRGPSIHSCLSHIIVVLLVLCI